MDDRYRGVYGERQVVFVNPADMAEMGVEAGDRADIIGQFDDGIKRVAENFRFVPYDIPRGCVAGYYPEMNVLVPLVSFGDESYTPTSKSVIVTFRKTAKLAA
ncbi:putative oxidoreductase [Paenochrobactrum sp. BZR 201-1]